MNRQRILIMLIVISVLGSTLVPASAISRQETVVRTAANPSKPSKTQQPFKRRIHMQQLMKRSEVPQEHRWKLQDLFGSRPEWDKEYELVLQLVDKMKQYHGKLNEAAALKACFELEDDISLHTERLYVYANMSHHEDTTDPVYQALSEKAKQLSVKVSEALSFITPEVLSLAPEGPCAEQRRRSAARTGRQYVEGAGDDLQHAEQCGHEISENQKRKGRGSGVDAWPLRPIPGEPQQ
jgi:oligoendopeptidase F